MQTVWFICAVGVGAAFVYTPLVTLIGLFALVAISLSLKVVGKRQ